MRKRSLSEQGGKINPPKRHPRHSAFSHKLFGVFTQTSNAGDRQLHLRQVLSEPLLFTPVHGEPTGMDGKNPEGVIKVTECPAARDPHSTSKGSQKKARPREWGLQGSRMESTAASSFI